MLNRKRLVRFPFLLDNNTMAYIFDKNVWDCEFCKTLFETIDLTSLAQTGALPSYNASDVESIEIMFPKKDEQKAIGDYFKNLDNLITLHHHEEFCTENVLIYIEINITIQIKEDIMAELESVIEQKLIDQLVYGDSQWTYRADLKTEEDLWNNFRYILEQNNKDRLNGEPLSDTEFEQVKN